METSHGSRLGSRGPASPVRELPLEYCLRITPPIHDEISTGLPRICPAPSSQPGRCVVDSWVSSTGPPPRVVIFIRFFHTFGLNASGHVRRRSDADGPPGGSLVEPAPFWSLVIWGGAVLYSGALVHRLARWAPIHVGPVGVVVRSRPIANRTQPARSIGKQRDMADLAPSAGLSNHRPRQRFQPVAIGGPAAQRVKGRSMHLTHRLGCLRDDGPSLHGADPSKVGQSCLSAG